MKKVTAGLYRQKCPNSDYGQEIAAERRQSVAPGASPGFSFDTISAPEGRKSLSKSFAPPGLRSGTTPTPGLRPGLHSVAAPRLNTGGFQRDLTPEVPSTVPALRQLRDVPATAQRLHKQDAGRHSSYSDADGGRLIRQQCILRGYDFQIGCYSAAVSIESQIDRALCGFNSGVFQPGFIGKDAQCRQVVFDFSKCQQDVLTISGHREVISCFCLLGNRASPPGIK